MHRMNHPHTHHFCQDVWTLDPLHVLALLKGRKIGGMWLSPDCKHFSKASGGALLSKRVRGLAWVAKKWMGRGGAFRVAPGRHGRVRRRGPACPRVMFLENVEEFRTWGPLIAKRDEKTGRVVKRDGSVAAKGERVPYQEQHLVPDKKRAGLYYKRLLRDAAEFGGNWQDRDIRAGTLGAPTIRKRLYGICRFDGQPVLWPEATHGAPESDEVRTGKLKPHRIIAEKLDFSLPCPSIFLTRAETDIIRRVTGQRINRPLKRATLARLAKGVEKFVLKASKPFIVELTHHGNAGIASVDDPIKTITGANRGEKSLVSPFLAVQTTGSAGGPADGLLKTVATGGHHVLGEAALAHYLVPRYGERKGQEPRTRSILEPSPVVVPGGNGGDLAAVSLVRTAHGAVDKTGKKRGRLSHSVAEQMPTATGSRDLALSAVHLTRFNSGAIGSGADELAPTVTANSFKKRPGGAPPLGVVAASIVKLRGSPDTHAPSQDITSLAHTISAGGNHLGVVAASLADPKATIPTYEQWIAATGAHGGTRAEYEALFLDAGADQRALNEALSQKMATYMAQHNGGERGHQTIGHRTDDPASTISGKGSQQQVVSASLAVPPLTPKLAEMARRVADFLREFGVKIEGEFAMVGDYVIYDIGMRMLIPRELYGAQGFPDCYIIERGMDEDETGRQFEIVLSKTAQIRMVGNSVSPVVAAALIAANLPEMIVERLAA